MNEEQKIEEQTISAEEMVHNLQNRVDYQYKNMNAWMDNAQKQLDRFSDRLYENKTTSDNEFWIKIWTMGALVTIVAFVTLTLCSIVEKTKIADMVAQGVDPTAARCAYPSQHDDAVCMAATLTSKIPDLKSSK